jgi:5'-nucleotidase
MLRVLLTNDDGFRAPGLRALAQQLAQHAAVTVVAPESPRSACSHSITLHKPLRLMRHANFLAGSTQRVTAYECSGTPADCITMGLQHVCRDEAPHVVLSGINDGPNLAEDLIYSGTVAGALEGELHGVPSLAVSLVGDRRMTYDEAAQVTELLLCCLFYGRCAPWQAGLLAQLAQGAKPADGAWSLPSIDEALGAELPEPAEWEPAGLLRTPCFNVNIPDAPLSGLSGIRWTGLGHREYHDVVVEQMDPRGRPFYWIWGKRIVPPQAPDSDMRAIAESAVAVTPMRGDLLNRSDLPRYLGLFTAGAATPEGGPES